MQTRMPKMRTHPDVSRRSFLKILVSSALLAACRTLDTSTEETAKTKPAVSTPTIPQDSSILAISAGEHHNLALKRDGSVWAWGLNSGGQLGTGRQSDELRAVKVERISDVIGISAGGYHSAVVTSAKSIWAWGTNETGELGIKGVERSFVPVQMQAVNNVMQVVAGPTSSAAILKDQTVMAWGIAWGANNVRQLGLADSASADFDVFPMESSFSGCLYTEIPYQIPTLENVVALAFGPQFSLALKADGNVWAWGRNTVGELGNGTFTISSPVPRKIDSLDNVVSISAGLEHSLALRNDGTVSAWGGNSSSQIGDPNIDRAKVPIQIRDIPSIGAISAGLDHSLAVGLDGSVWTWGWNKYGQLGNGDTKDQPKPAVVNITNVVAIAGGYAHSLALRDDGTVWAWGKNEFGQLGDGTTQDRLTPVQVLGLS